MNAQCEYHEYKGVLSCIEVRTNLETSVEEYPLDL